MSVNPQACLPADDPSDGHWFEGLADHLGAAYLRYSFTKGTVREVDSLIVLLGLEPGMTLLDVGCGPGRHSHEFARRGVRVTGVDISERFIQLATAEAPDGATFQRADARALDFDGAFDAAISLCPVSYTHLDVYKRQHQTNFISMDINFDFFCSISNRFSWRRISMEW